ncbi:MAG: VOC family protein [Candidatus Dormibacteria bacterium]
MIRIDHVVFAVADLEQAAEQLRRVTGLVAVPGGSHPQFGTSNRIAPLGNQYLELVAADDPLRGARSGLGRMVLAQAHPDRLQPIAVCLSGAQLDAVSRRLQQPPEAGIRVRPDGSRLSWRSLGMDRAFGREMLPFFIWWDRPERHPSTMAGGSAGRIAQVEIGGSADSLAAHLGEDVAELAGGGGPPGIRAVELELPGGERVRLA